MIRIDSPQEAQDYVRDRIGRIPEGAHSAVAFDLGGKCPIPKCPGHMTRTRNENGVSDLTCAWCGHVEPVKEGQAC